MSRSAWMSSARTRPTALGRSTSSAGSTGVWSRTISSALSTGITKSAHNHSTRHTQEPRTGGGSERGGGERECARGALLMVRAPPVLPNNDGVIPTVEWNDGEVVLIDQRRLPDEQVMIRCRSHSQVAAAIKDMAIRGAPAIGVAAAFGIALGVRNAAGEGPALRAELDGICQELASTRPTAVNLFWAIERMRRRFETEQHRGGAAIRQALLDEAPALQYEDL